MRLFVLFLFLGLAGLWDFFLHRIPNRLLVLGWLIGWAFLPGASYLWRSIPPLLLLQLLWYLKMAGGGDVKLAVLLCAWLGLEAAMWCFLYSLILAAFVGLVRLYHSKTLKIRFHYFWEYFRSGSLFLGIPYEGPAVESATIPFGTILFFGSLICLLQGGIS